MYQELRKKAETSLKDKQPFVLYRKPKTPQVIGIFQKDDALHTLTDFTESGFLFAPFESGRHNPIILTRADEVLYGDYSARSNPQKESRIESSFAHGPGAGHQALVRHGIRAIQETDLKKVVLSTQFEIPVNQTPLDIYDQLLALYPHAFCYLWYHPAIGLWLGATPEILLSARGNRLTTMSLAGTLAVEEGKKPTWTHKELEEQEMVTEFIKQVLKERITDLRTDALETVQAGTLWHLRTKIYGTYQARHLGKIIKALHPTPAVCGLPSTLAQDFLAQHEGYSREYYTGYFGELNMTEEKSPNAKGRNTEHKAYRSRMKATNLYVNLRCMQLKGNRAILYVGGGITAESDPAMEWLELCNKSKTMLKALM